MKYLYTQNIVVAAKLESLARGSYQKRLATGKASWNQGDLIGKAKQYQGSYHKSAATLAKRIEHAGLVMVKAKPKGCAYHVEIIAESRSWADHIAVINDLIIL